MEDDMRNMCMKYFVQLQQYIVELFVFKNFVWVKSELYDFVS